ncbi:MAG: 50S ribosomal protein L17 [Alphaproteobacteria bacterium]|nr:50S ribosomal protein L17 [Alphaproteobacteria bacterium]
MRHGHQGRKFGRKSSQRKALLSGLANSLIQFEQIKTTLAKAKDLRPYVEKLVTVGKNGDLSSRRQALAVLRSKDVVSKLISTLGERYKSRQGGYTRIIKAGFRYGDMAPMAIIEFVDRDVLAKPKQKKEDHAHHDHDHTHDHDHAHEHAEKAKA